MTLKPILLVLAAALIIASCDTPAKSAEQKETLVIKSKCAVVYSPDSLQIQKHMVEMGEENFRIGADDFLYYMSQSTEYLEKQGIKVIDSKSNKYLNFVLSDKSSKLIKLDTVPELWGIYLFDPSRQPHHADLTVIDQEVDSYYAPK